MRRSLYTLIFKRIFDFFLSGLLIFILFPIYLIIILLQIIFNGFPVFFVQPRVGKNEKIFNLYKFRTMSNEKDFNGNLLPDIKRRSKFGSFLRKTSLDEIPSLLNILLGDLSFVGPRPLLVKYLPYYTNTQRKRHLAKPGLSGLAQVKGRNSISWEEKFRFDLIYLEKISLFYDLKILILTFYVVIFQFEKVDMSKDQTFESFIPKDK